MLECYHLKKYRPERIFGRLENMRVVTWDFFQGVYTSSILVGVTTIKACLARKHKIGPRVDFFSRGPICAVDAQ
jgi:hypothetical protein